MKLTAAIKKKLSDDWCNALSGMTIWKPLWLLRRHGPLLVGVCLEPSRENEYYTPTAHVHSLVRRAPVVSFSLPVQGGPVTIGLHSTQVAASVEELVRNCEPLQRSSATLSAVVGYYRNFLAEKKNLTTNRAPYHPLRDVLGLYAYYGLAREARELLARVDYTVRVSLGDRYAKWVSDIEEILSDPSGIVEQETARLRLGGVTDLGMDYGDPLPLDCWSPDLWIQR